jgi:hypothetical protein
MGKRAYTHIAQFEPLIQSMREAGMTRQEIADELGLTKEGIKRGRIRLVLLANLVVMVVPMLIPILLSNGIFIENMLNDV